MLEPPPMDTVDESEKVQLFSAEVARCPHATYAQALEMPSLARAALTGQPVVARYEDVAWALRHPELFSSDMSAQVQLGNPRPMIPQQIDPPEQTRYRRLLDPLFSRRRMEKLAPAVREHANH